MSKYNHIDYRKHPCFNVGIVNQWGEQGYLLYEGMVYFFVDDRHDFYYSVENPRSPEDFLAFAKKKRISMPRDFRKMLKSMIR